MGDKTSGGAFKVPAGFGLTQLSIHELKADVQGGSAFAGTMLVQLRVDAPPGTSTSALLAADAKALSENLDGYVELYSGTRAIGACDVLQLEYTLAESGSDRTLQQILVYFTIGDEAYSLTATHRSGAAFERLRAALPGVLESLLTSQGKAV